MFIQFKKQDYRNILIFVNGVFPFACVYYVNYVVAPGRTPVLCRHSLISLGC